LRRLGYTVIDNLRAEGTAPMHLLLVEDDERLAGLTARLLADDHHVVEVTARGAEALEIAEVGGLDAIILDIGLPDMSGLEVARRLRAGGSRVAILMLTARDAVLDRVAGLDAGADDYLVKPFAHEELAARLRALVRRTNGSGPLAGRTLRCGPVVLDDAARSVAVGGRRVDLSPREFAMLECLLRHQGQILTRDQLLDHAWPHGVEVLPGSVDAYVYFLRRKLGADGGRLIETVRGIGYRMARP
jgi:two-component system OmpR family response regulator